MARAVTRVTKFSSHRTNMPQQTVVLSKVRQFVAVQLFQADGLTLSRMRLKQRLWRHTAALRMHTTARCILQRPLTLTAPETGQRETSRDWTIGDRCEQSWCHWCNVWEGAGVWRGYVIGTENLGRWRRSWLLKRKQDEGEENGGHYSTVTSFNPTSTFLQEVGKVYIRSCKVRVPNGPATLHAVLAFGSLWSLALIWAQWVPSTSHCAT